MVVNFLGVMPGRPVVRCQDGSALQGQLAAPQALEEAQREQATPAQGTQGTGTDDVSSCGMVQRVASRLQ